MTKSTQYLHCKNGLVAFMRQLQFTYCNERMQQLNKSTRLMKHILTIAVTTK